MVRSIPRMLLVLLAVAFACKPAQKTTSGSQGGKYYEDLSGVRPKAELPSNNNTVLDIPVQRDPKAYVEPRYAVNAQLDAVLDSINRINLTRKFVDGFTIQIYSGLSREEALNAKRDMTLYLPKVETEVQYNQPNFRTKTGKYLNRLEALRDYEAVKKFFPNAIVIPDKIAIN
jgi:hypothetical protein